MADILVARTNLKAKLPTQAYPNDVGFDLYCTENKAVAPKGITEIDCGIRMVLPTGFWGILVGRSSTSFRRGLLIVTAVIDPDYTGPMFIQVLNTTPNSILVKEGERLAQMVLVQSAGLRRVVEISVEDLDNPDAYWNEGNKRRQEGFGSSGQ